MATEEKIKKIIWNYLFSDKKVIGSTAKSIVSFEGDVTVSLEYYSFIYPGTVLNVVLSLNGTNRFSLPPEKLTKVELAQIEERLEELHNKYTESLLDALLVEDELDDNN